VTLALPTQPIKANLNPAKSQKNQTYSSTTQSALKDATAEEILRRRAGADRRIPSRVAVVSGNILLAETFLRENRGSLEPMLEPAVVKGLCQATASTKRLFVGDHKESF
jgi:hypothetical protein